MHRIAIDTVFFQHAYSGISRVWETLFKNFPHNSENDKYQIIIFQRANVKLKPELNLEKKFKIIPIPEFNYFLMGKDVDTLNYICKQHKIDVFISTYYTYTTDIPTVQLIHDMIPEVFKFPPNHMWKQKDLAIRNASAFICISKTTNNDLVRFYPHIETDRIPVEIIYNAIPPFIDSVDNLDDKFLIGNRIRPKTYIMAMATNGEEYKNAGLIKRFAAEYGDRLTKLMGNNHPIIMLTNENFPNGFKVDGAILYLTKVPDNMLNSLYKNALCFVCPSKYEGFGLPVFESFVRGVPVVALKLDVFEELCGAAVNYMDNTTTSLYEKIELIHSGHKSVSVRVGLGKSIVAKFSESEQFGKWDGFLENIDKYVLEPKPFINIILQTYNEKNLERLKELDYCILQNLNNPYIKHIHDFGTGVFAEKDKNDITNKNIITENQHYKTKYIIVSNPDNKWLTYEMAFTYANENSYKYGSHWCIVNLDVFLDGASRWDLVKGWLNSAYVFAQSRHEFSLGKDGSPESKLDANFSKMFHANTQDAWLFKTPIHINCHSHYNTSETGDANFEMGMLGCDNGIADRLMRSGYKVINRPEMFKVHHYDLVKGKTSSNFMEKHAAESKEKSRKPRNKYPERVGSFLVPNYDQLLGGNMTISLESILPSLGSYNNWEAYEMISKIMSDRIMISNP